MDALRHLAGPGISLWSDPETPFADGDLLAGGSVTGVGPSALEHGQAARLAHRLSAVHAASGGTDGVVPGPPPAGGVRPGGGKLILGPPFTAPGLPPAAAPGVPGTGGG